MKNKLFVNRTLRETSVALDNKKMLRKKSLKYDRILQVSF